MEKIPENRMKILLVDDDPLMLTILKNRYESRGYEVYTASSGEEAIRVFEKETPSLVISDYVMQGMDGDELCLRLKSLDSNVKILMLTGKKLDSFIIKAMKSGADDYMTKPFSPIELDFKIEKLLKG